METSRNKLQKVVGDDNVLVVKFSDINNIDNDVGAYYNFYRQVAEDGITLGLRRYRFLSKFPCPGMHYLLGYM